MSRRNDWGLFDAQKKRDRLNQIREDRLAKEQAQAAAEAARLAEIEAAEQAKRDEAAALDAELAAAEAEISEAQAAMERARLARVKADASTPEIVAAMWDRAEGTYDVLMSVKHGSRAERLRVFASLTMKQATGVTVPLELWQPEAGGNIASLHEFAGFNWRVIRIAPETLSALQSPDTFLCQVETASKSWVSVYHPANLAELVRQYPSMRPANYVSPPQSKPEAPGDNVDDFLARSAAQQGLA
jgi:hypothetical protein